MPDTCYKLKALADFEKIKNYNDMAVSWKQIEKEDINPEQEYITHLMTVFDSLSKIIKMRAKTIKQQSASQLRTSQTDGFKNKTMEFTNKSSVVLNDRQRMESQIEKASFRKEKEHQLYEIEVQNQIRYELEIRKIENDSKRQGNKAERIKQVAIDDKVKMARAKNDLVFQKQQKVIEAEKGMPKKDLSPIRKFYEQMEVANRRIEQIKLNRDLQLAEQMDHMKNKAKQQMYRKELVEKLQLEQSNNLKEEIEQRNYHVNQLMTNHWTHKLLGIKQQNNIKQEKTNYAKQLQQEGQQQVLQKIVQNYKSHYDDDEIKQSNPKQKKKGILEIEAQNSATAKTPFKQKQKELHQNFLMQKEKLKAQQEEFYNTMNDNWQKKILQSQERQNEIELRQKDRMQLRTSQMMRNSKSQEQIFNQTQNKWDQLLNKEKRVQDQVQNQKKQQEALRSLWMQETIQLQMEKEKKQKQLERLSKIPSDKLFKKVQDYKFPAQEMVKFFPESVKQTKPENEQND